MKPETKRKTWWIVIPAVIALALDLFTKKLALDHLGIESVNVVVIPNFLNLVGRINTGGAFSLMAGHTTLLTALSIAALVFLIWWAYSLPDQNRLLWTAFGLIIGGALGNLFDRIYRAGVVDFIDAHWGSAHWPTFNIADSAICVGLGLVVVLTIIVQPEEVKNGNSEKCEKLEQEKPQTEA